MDNASSRTALYDFARDSFRAAALTVLGSSNVQVLYSGLAQEEPADGAYWARISRSVVDEFQETLRNGQGQRRFRTVGILFVQLFGPRSDSRSLDRIDKIAEIVRNDFRTHQPGELEFTNAVISDNVLPEPSWQRANVVADYTYRQFIS